MRRRGLARIVGVTLLLVGSLLPAPAAATTTSIDPAPAVEAASEVPSAVAPVPATRDTGLTDRCLDRYRELVRERLRETLGAAGTAAGERLSRARRVGLAAELAAGLVRWADPGCDGQLSSEAIHDVASALLTSGQADAPLTDPADRAVGFDTGGGPAPTPPGWVLDQLVQGTLTSATDGSPIEGIHVVTCLDGSYCDPDLGWMTSDDTDAAGHFELWVSNEFDDYRLTFTDPQRRFAAGTWDEGYAPIQTYGGQVSWWRGRTYDAALPPAIPLTARVLDASLGPIEGAPVSVCLGAERWCRPGPTVTDADGRATVLVAEGTYHLGTGASDELPEPAYSTGWYRAGPGYTPDPDLSTPVHVTDATAVTLVMPPVRSISGRVIAADGSPTAPGTLDVSACLVSAPGWTEPRCRGTDVSSDGTYLITGVSAGTYTIKVSTYADMGFVGGWYAAAAPGRYVPFADFATSLDVSSGDLTLGDLTLPLGGRIGGVVTDPWGPASGASVVACSITAGPGCHSLSADSEGRFLTPPLRPGRYILLAYAEGRDGFSVGWYAEAGGFSDDAGLATVIDVGIHGVGDLAIRLPAGPGSVGEPTTFELSGRVNRADGGAADDAYVTVCPEPNSEFLDCYGAEVWSGEFSLRVPAGDYVARFEPVVRDRSDLSAPGYYSAGLGGNWSPTRADATVFDVAADRSLGTVTFGTGTRFTGTIRDASTGEPIPSVMVDICMVSEPQMCGGAYSDSQGYFETWRALARGSYTVRFETWDALHLGGWYDATAGAARFTPDPDHASSVSTGDAERGQLEVALPRGRFVSGLVTAADTGWAMPWGSVLVVCALGNQEGWVRWDGRYRVGPLPPGDCTVRHGPGWSDYVSGYLGASGSIVETEAEATRITIGAGDRAGVDLRVQRGVRVSGRVIDSRNGLGLTQLWPQFCHPDCWREGGDTHGPGPERPAGRWVERALFPGTYVLRFDLGSRLPNVWYDPDDPSHVSTEPVAFDIGPDDLVLPDMVVPVGYRIATRLAEPAPAGTYSGRSVTVCPGPGPLPEITWRGACSPFPTLGGAWTKADGSLAYVDTWLADGAYRLLVDGVAYAAGQPGNVAYGLANATPISISGGDVVLPGLIDPSALGTPPGTTPVMDGPVTVAPVDTYSGTQPVTLSFGGVTAPGTTSLTITSNGPAPSGFSLGSPSRYFQLSTTATYSGRITVCVSYVGITLPGAPRLYHHTSGAWADVTTTVDATNRIVCGVTDSLSPFAVGVVASGVGPGGGDGGGGGAAPPLATGPTITTQPADRTSGVGTNVTFRVASSEAGATVAWETSADGQTWSGVPGARSATLTVRVTPSLDGRRYRAVLTSAGGSTTSRDARLSVAVVTRLSPARGGVGRTVLLTGARLGGAMRVIFGGRVASPRVVALDTSSILVSVPAGARTGAITLDFGGGGTATVPGAFTVSGRTAPTIASVAPASVAVGGTLTIAGTNLVGVTSVRLGGVAVAYRVVSGSVIRVVVPAGARGGPVTIATAGGTARSRGSVTIR